MTISNYLSKVLIASCCLALLMWYNYAKQKQPGCKNVRGQSEATMVIGDQKL